ncbi:MAG: hypothetical protein M0D57_00135 [Sphingobacteriales bacterium JAD_PAG50586_3]|nr:MAG: hypothetical protein M0D57_00135 [Sphingobacteriales bacterium JAD_PAG50586_3]
MENYLEKIMLLDIKEFIYVNIELTNSLYVNQLFLCLPEIWQKVTVDDIVYLADNFTKTTSYFTLIQFICKYIQVDFISYILKSKNIRHEEKIKIKQYLKLQWNVLILSDIEREFLETGFENEYIQYNPETWSYIRQLFLLDNRISPLPGETEDFRKFIEELTNSFFNPSRQVLPTCLEYI